jgi:hypothetical protein
MSDAVHNGASEVLKHDPEGLLSVCKQRVRMARGNAEVALGAEMAKYPELMQRPVVEASVPVEAVTPFASLGAQAGRGQAVEEHQRAAEQHAVSGAITREAYSAPGEQVAVKPPDDVLAHAESMLQRVDQIRAEQAQNPYNNYGLGA